MPALGMWSFHADSAVIVPLHKLMTFPLINWEIMDIFLVHVMQSEVQQAQRRALNKPRSSDTLAFTTNASLNDPKEKTKQKRTNPS